MGAVIKANFHWNFDPLTAHGLEPNGPVQMAIDNAVISYCMPYAPFETGTLARSPYLASPPGGGKVIYDTPYARYLYYGLAMAPSIPVFEDDSGVPTRFFSPPGQKKHLKNPPQALVYNTDTNPLAGSYWFERMKSVHAEDIVREAQRVAGR